MKIETLNWYETVDEAFGKEEVSKQMKLLNKNTTEETKNKKLFLKSRRKRASNYCYKLFLLSEFAIPE